MTTKGISVYRLATVAVTAAAVVVGGCINVPSNPFNPNPRSHARNEAHDAARDTRRAAHQEAGRQIGAAIAGQVTPHLQRFYTTYMLRMAFYAGGYSVAPAAHDYEPGEYTEWEVHGESTQDNRAVMRRAFLGTDADGNEWWQVKYTNAEDGSTIIMESLFSPDMQQLLRMRAKWPNDRQPQEVPVTENQYYQAPQRLTEQSLEGGTRGYETVTTPAGSFNARHVVFGNPGGDTQEWWMTDRVPGGVVKYLYSSPTGGSGNQPADASYYDLRLVDYGANARSELGVL